MTPNDYIEKAKHALLTDQPNLAMLYMRRGLVEMKRRRPTLQDSFDAANEAVREFGRAFNSLVDVFSSVFDAFAGVATSITEMYDREFFEIARYLRA